MTYNPFEEKRKNETLARLRIDNEVTRKEVSDLRRVLKQRELEISMYKTGLEYLEARIKELTNEK